MSESENLPIRRLAQAIRVHSLNMTAAAQASHVASALGCADILAVLYADVLNHRPAVPYWPERDRFIMSKGHAAAALYSVLSESGYFSISHLQEYGEAGTALAGHPLAGDLPGVEFSTGSLGHGLPLSLGMARALKDRGSLARVFCLVSDGECQEGAVWEAALLASQWSMGNLHVIVDANDMQGLGPVAEIASLEPMTDKWKAFGWDVREVDGHDPTALGTAFRRSEEGTPLVTIARTVKGHGVAFMEGRLEWHYRAPSKFEVADALKDLGAT